MSSRFNLGSKTFETYFEYGRTAFMFFAPAYLMYWVADPENRYFPGWTPVVYFPPDSMRNHLREERLKDEKRREEMSPEEYRKYLHEQEDEKQEAMARQKKLGSSDFVKEIRKKAITQRLQEAKSGKYSPHFQGNSKYDEIDALVLLEMKAEGIDISPLTHVEDGS